METRNSLSKTSDAVLDGDEDASGMNVLDQLEDILTGPPEGGLQMTTKRKGGTLYLRNVPPAVKHTFRLACMARGKPMNEVLVDFMAEYALKAGKVSPDKKAPKEKP